MVQISQLPVLTVDPHVHTYTGAFLTGFYCHFDHPEVAMEVRISQLAVLTVDPNVHTGAFLTGFYRHFDHPQQYKTMLLPVKNS